MGLLYIIYDIIFSNRPNKNKLIQNLKKNSNSIVTSLFLCNIWYFCNETGTGYITLGKSGAREEHYAETKTVLQLLLKLYQTFVFPNVSFAKCCHLRFNIG